jgi:hypothetical protein
MNKILIAIATLAFISTAQAQTAAPTYADVQRTCGMEWKASDTRKSTPKGEGREAWQAFLKTCTDRKGYVSKRNRVPEGFVPVPDKG